MTRCFSAEPNSTDLQSSTPPEQPPQPAPHVWCVRLGDICQLPQLPKPYMDDSHYIKCIKPDVDEKIWPWKSLGNWTLETCPEGSKYSPVDMTCNPPKRLQRRQVGGYPSNTYQVGANARGPCVCPYQGSSGYSSPGQSSGYVSSPPISGYNSNPPYSSQRGYPGSDQSKYQSNQGYPSSGSVGYPNLGSGGYPGTGSSDSCPCIVQPQPVSPPSMGSGPPYGAPGSGVSQLSQPYPPVNNAIYPCPTVSNNGVPGAQPNGTCSWMLAELVANPMSRKTYLQCVPVQSYLYCGRWMVRPCEEDLIFNPSLQVCVQPDYQGLGSSLGAGTGGYNTGLQAPSRNAPYQPAPSYGAGGSEWSGGQTYQSPGQGYSNQGQGYQGQSPYGGGYPSASSVSSNALPSYSPPAPMPSSVSVGGMPYGQPSAWCNPQNIVGPCNVFNACPGFSQCMAISSYAAKNDVPKNGVHGTLVLKLKFDGEVQENGDGASKTNPNTICCSAVEPAKNVLISGRGLDLRTRPKKFRISKCVPVDKKPKESTRHSHTVLTKNQATNEAEERNIHPIRNEWCQQMDRR
ncbi:unnamed protein product [Soboliphyme baturini]|uniref:Chitin-binding type-2 domain-containing protein n=1 Tax=Soboliphyme baturini TaxID=241478 RepID=A0A183ISX1_9BILA|nr:unnamed protein product [Soboliphyme baturini]